MAKYRQILRLHSQGVSGRGIAASCQCSWNTVKKVLENAERLAVSWPLAEDVFDGDLERLLFPEESRRPNRKLPDCEHIHKEMAKSGVTLSLLWHEYCEQCRPSNEIPLM